MKTKGSRKRRDEADCRRVLAMVKMVFRRAAKDATGTPRPRKRIDCKVAKRAYEHALRMIAMNGTDAVLLLQERDRTGKAMQGVKTR